MSTPKKIFWTIFGFVLFLVCFLRVQTIFVAPRSLVYNFLGEFYKEPENSLDAVIIGASQAYDSWSAPIAFDQYGMTSWSFCCPRLSAKFLIYFMEEVRKAQPDALMIINLNLFHNLEINDTNLSWAVNHLPYSWNKIKMVHYLGGEAGFSPLERLNYLFPVLNFHSRWPELSSFFFLRNTNGLKSAMHSSAYFTKIDNVSSLYLKNERSKPLDVETEAVLQELLEYCRQKKIKPLFISVPEPLEERGDFIEELNTIESIIRENGYECLDFLNMIEETGIQTRQDFSDTHHMNIHGTLKFTQLFARYLSEHYGFTDKRGQAGYESWEKSVHTYTKLISPYTLPFERENASRNYELPIPKLITPQVEGGTVTLTWEKSPAADSYSIYRKNANNKAWTYLAAADADTLQYIDSGLEPAQTYTYTVVPQTTANGTEQYGNYSYNGISAKTP